MSAQQATRRLCVLGATGSVGRSTLEVAAAEPERVQVVALAAHRDVEAMVALIAQHRPARVAMADPAAAARLRERVGAGCEVLEGAEGLCTLAADADSDTVMAAIVGAAGLPATLAAAEAGKRVLLATKEALVTAGRLLMQAVADSGAQILPVDSEHNAIFQCLPRGYTCGARPSGVRRLLLTASGGPFRCWSAAQMHEATPAQAVAHPNWDMGAKISVDSASMMNKGLELIEAAYLYAMPESDIDVLVHPQSIIHSAVEFVDGSLLAQMGTADMKIPIAHALLHPQRGCSGAQRLDLLALGRLDFEPPDPERFPALRLAREALRSGGLLPAVLNAANEVAVARFLAGAIGFTAIAALVEAVLEQAAGWAESCDSIAAVLDVDARARALAQGWEAARG